MLTPEELADLVRRHPLPEGVPDAVLNRNELAEFFDRSALTVTAWLNAGMPVLREGGQGQPYEFQASHCWAWRQAHLSAEETRSAEARAAIQAQRLALVGGGSGDTIEALDPKQRREIYAAQIEGERLAAQRKQLLPRRAVADMTEQLLVLVRDTMESAPDRVERETAIPAEAVTALVDICDGLTAEFERRIRRFWDLNREQPDPAAERKDLFDQDES